jgi:isopenicillin-N N-acyltransferase-like protein
VTIRTIILEGSPEQIGEAHGEALRDEIHDCLGRWREDLGTTYETSPDRLLRDFIAQTSLIRTAERLAPDLHTELNAIARAANVDPDRLWAWNLLDEVWCFAGRRLGGFTVPEGTACSSVGVVAGPAGASLVAQNMDLDAFNTWDPLVLRLRPVGGQEALVLVDPGILAQCGCNAAGVAICTNALSMLRNSIDGLPVGLLDFECRPAGSTSSARVSRSSSTRITPSSTTTSGMW